MDVFEAVKPRPGDTAETRAARVKAAMEADLDSCHCMFISLDEVCPSCRALGHTENADLEDYRDGTLPGVLRLMRDAGG